MAEAGAEAWTAPLAIVGDCITTALHLILQEDADTDDGVATANDKFIRVADEFCTWCQSLAATQSGDDRLATLAQVLQGALTSAKAARKDVDVSIQDPRAGFATIGDKPVARKLQEGFAKSVLGQAIKLSAQTLLVAGELDEQCSAEFLDASRGLLELGVTESE